MGEVETEKYEVEIQRDVATGKVVLELWAHPDDRKPLTIGGTTALPIGWNPTHRIGAPAAMRWDPTTGVMIKECWYIRGQLHREDGPAIIKRDPNTGRVIFSSWYRNGKLIPRAERPKDAARKRTKPTSQGPNNP